jgi:hypothetical protein
VAGTKNPEHFKKIILEKEYLAGLNFKHEMEMCGTIQGRVLGHAEGGRAIKDRLLLHKVLSLSFCHAVYAM